MSPGIDQPGVVQIDSRITAVIRLTIPRADIRQVMGPAIQEVLGTLAGQGIVPAGPLFSRHFRIDPEIFDVEIGVPVEMPVAASGRVVASQLPAGKAARAVYRGPYEALGTAWGEFKAWIAAEGLQPGEGLWECYVAGPEASPDPAQWRTELVCPLAG